MSGASRPELPLPLPYPQLLAYLRLSYPLTKSVTDIDLHNKACIFFFLLCTNSVFSLYYEPKHGEQHFQLDQHG